jgi:hypothetical protein
MKNKKLIKISLIVLVIVLAGILGYATFIEGTMPNIKNQNQARPEATSTQPLKVQAACQDGPNLPPFISSLSAYSGKVGDLVEVNGCNFLGFEGDENIWLENAQGLKGIIYGEKGSSIRTLKIVLKSALCQKDNSYSGLPCAAQINLVPGKYKIYTSPWGKDSNKVDFTIN